MHQLRKLGLACACLAALVAVTAGSGNASSRSKLQKTVQITHGNGQSTNAVISGDRRWARAIAFESDASNLVPGDSNGLKDVFVVRRGGRFDNRGQLWKPGKTRRVSRSRTGGAANGPSYSPAVSGGFDVAPKCVAYLSDASNLVAGDRNGVTDAFVSGISRGTPKRVSLPTRRESAQATTQVTVSADCTKVAFVNGGRLYVTRTRGRVSPHRVTSAGAAADPSFAVGRTNDLVFGDSRGVEYVRNGFGNPRLVGPGGRNPALNGVRDRVVAYEKHRGGHWQIAFHALGSRQRYASIRRGQLGNANSRNPMIANSGKYVTFETDATNLGVNATGRIGDFNGRPDTYLYTDNRKLTLVQSVEEKAVPLNGGGRNPSMSFYANYVVFDSPAPMNAAQGTHQIFMRYLGPV
ncbi:MAG: hypothetical protein QOF65_21 [Thermoleophilaceae bacterium]|jgi:hypothetical protein|nr:hypothetical protein [Thermoleophilaceae bacterium]